MTEAAAIGYALLVSVIVLFQWCLAAGAPWGHLTMGGFRRGRLPVALRLAAAVQSLLLICLGSLVLAQVGIGAPQLEPYARYGVWAAVVVSALALGLNVITPSKAERRLWAPTCLLMLVCASIVALGPNSR